MKRYTIKDLTRHYSGNGNQRGTLLILAMIVVFAMSAIGFGLAQTVFTQYTSNKQKLYVENAVSAAEAGISATKHQLVLSSSFTGYADTNRQTVYNDADRGKADYSTTVTNNTDGTKTIVATGYVYRPNETTPYNTKRIKVIVKQENKTITTPSVFAGSGGLSISNGAAGPDVTSNVVNVLGKITMSNHGVIGGSAITGATGTPTVNVANKACGTASDYPIACPSNQQPLVMSGYSRIYGNVCATNQVDQYMGVFNNEGIFPPGTLQPNCTAPIAAMPFFDKEAFVNSMTSTAAGTTAGCSTGSRTWTANRTYTGNVTASLYCNVTVAGDVYITGNLSLSNVTLHAANGLTTPPTIVVNGSVSLWTSVMEANSQNTGVRIISFHSSDAACSNSSSCISLSSAHALSSANMTVINCQFCRPDASILWSYFGRTYLGGGPPFPLGPLLGIGAVMGAAITMDNYSYGISGSTWMGAPPGTVTIPGNFVTLDYQQLY